MINSMTGYGRCEKEVSGFVIRIELKSVNHRYIDFSIRMPRHYSFLEDNIREYLKKYINRGKIDIYISIESIAPDAKVVSLNEDYTKNYIEVLRNMRDLFGIKDDISVSNVARNMDVFNLSHAQDDADVLWAALSECLDETVQSYCEMRSGEGLRLQSDINEKLGLIEKLVTTIKELEPVAAKEYAQRMKERIYELLDGVNIDEGRVLTEVAIFADKVSIDEEIVRLNSHIDGFRATIAQGGSIGKKLDFMLQEMNREINTIGSKANSLDISKLVIEVKSQLEKIREQIQNIE